jgi:hypothetical protein
MVIRICKCEHPDTLHVVDLADDASHTAKGKGACYESKCDCTTFREQVQLVQLVSHREHHDDIALLVGLDAQGRAWWWNDGSNVWEAWGDVFLVSQIGGTS